jgi:hypothetical protein
MSTTAWIAIAAVVLVACGVVEESEIRSSPSATVIPVTTTTSEATVITPDPIEDTDLAALVDWATAHLADEMDVDPAEIDVRTAEKVTWNDGSIGCSEPGVFYTQALVEGARVILALGGVEYAYHQSDGQEPFLCDDPGEGGGPLSSLGPDPS